MVATPRSFSVVLREDGIFHVNPITISSTPASFKIIQPIQIVSPGTQSSPVHNQTPRPSLKTNPLPSRTKLPRFPKQQPLSLSFEDEPSVAVLGRQVAGKPVEGFPNGLPALTPLGVRITLENMFGMDSWLYMMLSIFVVRPTRRDGDARHPRSGWYRLPRV